jgi:hypothetical protein
MCITVLQFAGDIELDTSDQERSLPGIMHRRFQGINTDSASNQDIGNSPYHYAAHPIEASLPGSIALKPFRHLPVCK